MSCGCETTDEREKREKGGQGKGPPVNRDRVT